MREIGGMKLAELTQRLIKRCAMALCTEIVCHVAPITIASKACNRLHKPGAYRPMR